MTRACDAPVGASRGCHPAVRPTLGPTTSVWEAVLSFDRPGLPHPGHELRPEVDETLAEEGVELDHHDHAPDVPDHPGGRSSGPQPNPPRRPSHDSAAEAHAETE